MNRLLLTVTGISEKVHWFCCKMVLDVSCERLLLIRLCQISHYQYNSSNFVKIGWLILDSNTGDQRK